MKPSSSPREPKTLLVTVTYFDYSDSIIRLFHTNIHVPENTGVDRRYDNPESVITRSWTKAACNREQFIEEKTGNSALITKIDEKLKLIKNIVNKFYTNNT